MKTTVKHVGSVREWEGQVDNWLMHEDVIQHWCDGGDVEDCSDESASAKLLRSHLIPLFDADREYRIKPREPKPGEVWVDEDGNAIHIPFDCEKWQFLDISGYKNNKYPITDIKYSAPSVKAYYARKFRDDEVELFNDSTERERVGVNFLHGVVLEAAKLEK